MASQEDIDKYLAKRKEEKANEAKAEALRKKETSEFQKIQREHDVLEQKSLESSTNAAAIAIKTQDLAFSAATGLSVQGQKLEHSDKLAKETVKAAENATGLAKGVEKYGHIFGIKFKNPWSASRKERLAEKALYENQLKELGSQLYQVDKSSKKERKGNKTLEDRMISLDTAKEKRQQEEEEEGQAMSSSKVKQDILQLSDKQKDINKNLDVLDASLDNILMINQDMTSEVSRQKVLMQQIGVRQEHIEFNIEHGEKKIYKYT